MNHTKLATITVLLFFVAALAISPAFAAVTVQTDKASYSVGDSLTVSGTVAPVVPAQDVAIVVKDPAGSIQFVAQVTPSAAGAYSTVVGAFSQGQASGSWTVTATYNGASQAAVFTLVGIPAQAQITLGVSVDAGTLYFQGETATLYVLTTNAGVPTDAIVNATLYPPSGASVALTATKVTTGVAKLTYAIPAAAGTGT